MPEVNVATLFYGDGVVRLRLGAEAECGRTLEGQFYPPGDTDCQCVSVEILLDTAKTMKLKVIDPKENKVHDFTA